MTASKPSTILIIDDDADMRYSLSRVLSSEGYDVSEAGSGEEGVETVKKGPAPDLIFLDVRMGGMSGIEALQHICSSNRQQLVILMTAFGTAQTAIEAMKYGAFDYIMKPFDPEKVLSLASKALQTHADLSAVGDYESTVNVDDWTADLIGALPGARLHEYEVRQPARGHSTSFLAIPLEAFDPAVVKARETA